jgi:hypothetical protein
VEQSFPPATLERFSLDSNCVYNGWMKFKLPVVIVDRGYI